MAVLDMPIYFVLGNHDFYRGSVVGTRSALAEMISGSEHLVYLSQAGVVELTPSTALVGHDGWADARLGDFDGSEVILNDFLLIDELRCWRDHHTLDKPALRQALQALGDEAARYLKASWSGSGRKVSARHRRHPRSALPRGRLVSGPSLRRRLPALLLLQGRGRRVAGDGGGASALRSAGPLRPHARRRRGPGAGEPAGADRPGGVREARDPTGHRRSIAGSPPAAIQSLFSRNYYQFPMRRGWSGCPRTVSSFVRPFTANCWSRNGKAAWHR